MSPVLQVDSLPAEPQGQWEGGLQLFQMKRENIKTKFSTIKKKESVRVLYIQVQYFFAKINVFKINLILDLPGVPVVKN